MAIDRHLPLFVVFLWRRLGSRFSLPQRLLF
jgi:hypothetical protein